MAKPRGLRRSQVRAPPRIVTSGFTIGLQLTVVDMVLEDLTGDGALKLGSHSFRRP